MRNNPVKSPEHPASLESRALRTSNSNNPKPNHIQPRAPGFLRQKNHVNACKESTI